MISGAVIWLCFKQWDSWIDGFDHMTTDGWIHQKMRYQVYVSKSFLSAPKWISIGAITGLFPWEEE